MGKKIRIVAVSGCVLLVLLGVGFLLLRQGIKHVPEAYRQALEIDPQVLQSSSDQMLQKAAALASDVKKEGQWDTLFTAEQINGWLAYDVARNHSQLLPQGISDPRVAITPERVMLFFRAAQGGVESIITVAVEPYVPRANVLALRIRGVYAGAIPIPMKKILDEVAEASGNSNIPLHWQQAQGDPVALITLDEQQDNNGKFMRVETLKLGQGEVYVAGTTEKDGKTPDGT